MKIRRESADNGFRRSSTLRLQELATEAQGLRDTLAELQSDEQSLQRLATERGPRLSELRSEAQQLEQQRSEMQRPGACERKKDII